MVGIVDPAGSTTIRLPTSVGVSVADPVREDAPRRNLESAQPGVLGQRIGDRAEMNESDQGPSARPVMPRQVEPGSAPDGLHQHDGL